MIPATAPTNPCVTSFADVTIRYGQTVAVDGATAEFPAGAVGLLGRNGAGKSSILKALLGLVPLATGKLRILDLAPDASGAEIRRRVGYMPERDAWITGLNGYETVRLAARLSGVPSRLAAQRAHETLYLVGLDEQRYRLVAGYSAGMRQKVKLACALVHDPEVLFLDEPTNGLDPGARVEMLAAIRSLTEDLGKSVVLSSHILQDVERTCQHIVLLDRGRVIESGRVDELTRHADRRYDLDVEGSLDGELDAALRARGAREVEANGPGRFVVAIPEGAGPRCLFQAVCDVRGVVRRLAERRRTLEQVFLGAVGSPAIEAPADSAPGADGVVTAGEPPA